MRIETQLSADNNIMHFFPEHPLVASGCSEFSDAKSLRRSPLAENIFDLGSIRSIMITPDCISVTKEATAGWEDLKPQVLAEIMDYGVSGEAVINIPAPEEKEELAHCIAGLIDARIRPAIRKDGGDIVLRGFENGIVYVELQGKCVGCPYAQRTLKEGVEKILKTYIREVVAVEKFTGETA